MQIQEKPLFNSLFEWIGGETPIKAMVERFYDLMEFDPAYETLRTLHGNDLSVARQRLFWFLCGWMGGPQYYSEQLGHPRLRMRHMPFAIGVIERDQWLACMAQAMSENHIAPAVQAHLAQSFFQTVDWMRNQTE
jgi:hemoglobin